MLADNIAVTHLTKIRRQKEPGLLRAVELTTQGCIDEAINLLVKQHRVTEIKDSASRYEGIAAEYLAAHEARQNCLVVSPANEERLAINQAIRQKLVDAGYVQSLGLEHPNPDPARYDGSSKTTRVELPRRRSDLFQARQPSSANTGTRVPDGCRRS
jgi:hypothetical protein